MIDPQYALAHFRTFAVVGATPNPEKYGCEIVTALLAAGYEVFPVNPKYKEILSQPCYPSLAAMPQKPDVVIIALASESVASVVEECAKLDCRVVWMPPGCWSHAALEACRHHRLGFIFDRCPVGELSIAPSRPHLPDTSD